MDTSANPKDNSLRLEIIDRIEQIEASRWNALAQISPTHTIFQTYEFNCVASRIYGGDKGSLILCVFDKDKLIAIFPLMFLTTGGGLILQFLAGHRSDYGDILGVERRPEALELFWKYLLSRRQDWDLIHLGNVPLESDLALHIREDKDLKRVTHRCSQDEAVCIRFGDNEAYTKEVFHKRRILEYRNHLKKNGHYEILHLTDTKDIEVYLEDFFAQHIERWQKTASPSLFLDAKNKEFYRAIVRELPTGWVTLSVLKWKERLLGFHFGLSYGKRFIWYKPSFNLEFSRYSPGQVLLQEVMEYSRAKGFEEFDFGVGKEAYKNRFGNIISRNNSFKVFSSRSGYLCYYVPRAIQWRLRQMFGK